MKRFKNILLVCNGDHVTDDVLGRAIWLAKANEAKLVLAGTVANAPGDLANLYSALPGVRAHDVEFEMLEFHRARIAEIAAPVKSEGIETSEIVLQGIPFVEIIRRVVRDGHDLVLKGTPGEPNGMHPIFASTDLHLLRKCPCPVWIMKETRKRRFARVLAAVDPDPQDSQRDALNTMIMELATSLSARDNSELHVVNAWQLEGESTLRDSGFLRVAQSEIDLLLEDRQRQSEDRLHTLAAGYPDLDGRRHLHLCKGPAREVVTNFAEKQRVDLIVMGTVARTGIRGLFIGNTAEAILNHVDCSVLAVKPPGFESPVA